MEKEAETKIESDVCVPVTPTLSESEGDATDLCRLPTGGGGLTGPHTRGVCTLVFPSLPLPHFCLDILREPARPLHVLITSR